VTTVGYGDVSPATTGGRVIAIVVMIVGIGFVAVLTAAAAERFVRARRADSSELVAVHKRLDEIVARLDAMERRR
jgi:voltage-gated potassium channel